MAVVITMCKLMTAMAIGFLLFRLGIFDKNANAKMSALILKVTCPALLVYSVSTVARGDNALIAKLFLLGIVTYAGYIAIGYLFPRVFRLDKELRNTYMCMMIFANTAFMGYPVAQSLFGDSAIFYIAVFNLPFNFLYFSLALYLLQKEGNASINGNETRKVTAKDFLNPGIIASAFALIVYFAGIELPALVTECCAFIGNVTMPLSMIIIGSSVASASFGDIRHEKGILPMLIFRLALIPVLVYLFLGLTGLESKIVKMCALSAAMPVASMVGMGTVQYPKQGKTASIAVAVSTLVSMLTIPVVAMILGA